MNNNNYHKVRQECYTQLGRRGGKNYRHGKRALRRKWKNWQEKQEFKENRKFNEND